MEDLRRDLLGSAELRQALQQAGITAAKSCFHPATVSPDEVQRLALGDEFDLAFTTAVVYARTWFPTSNATRSRSTNRSCRPGCRWTSNSPAWRAA